MLETCLPLPRLWIRNVFGLMLICTLAGCANGSEPETVHADVELDVAPALEPAGSQEVALAEVAPDEEIDVAAVRQEAAKPYAAGSSPETTRVGEDWPVFLGPRGTGISGEKGLMKTWPKEGPPIVWKKEVGTGYSAPSVLGNRLVLHHRLRFEEIVDCFEADTGKLLWHYAYPSFFRDPYGYNNGPRCSPLLTPTRCYTFGADGKLLCLDLKSGEKVWLRDTASDFDIPDAFFGVGSTPILHGNLLLVMVGAEPRAGVVAFRADNGKTVWESVSKATITFPDRGYDPDDKLASYSSMMSTKIGDKWHLLALMRDGLVSLDPLTGKVNFSYFFRSRISDSVNAARPVVVGDQIFLSAAYRTGAALLKVEPGGMGVEELWRNRSMETHWSTSIYHEGGLFGFSGRHEPEATFRCVDIKTGDVIWETEGASEDAPFSSKDGLGEVASKYYGRGSAILADGKFIVQGERGLLALVDADPKKFTEISRVKYEEMKYPSWTAPVLSRKRLYLRCEDALLCLDLKPVNEE